MESVARDVRHTCQLLDIIPQSFFQQRPYRLCLLLLIIDKIPDDHIGAYIE